MQLPMQASKCARAGVSWVQDAVDLTGKLDAQVRVVCCNASDCDKSGAVQKISTIEP